MATCHVSRVQGDQGDADGKSVNPSKPFTILENILFY